MGSETARVAAAVAGAPLVAELLIAVAGLSGAVATAIRVAAWVEATVTTMVVVVRPLVSSLITARLARDDLRAELFAERADRRFRAQVERALAQADAEPATLRAALRAVGELQPDCDVTLLLSVPDEARVGWTVRLLDGQLLPARPIPDTPGCTALAANRTVETTSSTGLDSCAHLQDPTMEVSATCVPLRLGDRILGVVSLQGPPGERLHPTVMETLEWLVERTGVRIAEQRRHRGHSTAGRDDPVTGLPGAAAFDRNLRELVRSLTPFCVSMVELDDFPDVELRYGEALAEEGIRVMGDALRLTLRPDDLVCRLEGPHFGVILANCAAPQASAALERVREALVLSIAADEGPHVTFSAGVVESHRATSIEGLLEQARAAAKRAHSNGGNRVAVAHD